MRWVFPHRGKNFVGHLQGHGRHGALLKPYATNRRRRCDTGGLPAGFAASIQAIGSPWRRFMKTTDSYHKWVEWSEEDGVYIGKCPDLISGIHGDDPVRVYADLARVVEEVVAHFEQSGRQLPPPRVRPMQEVG
jgi:hypothetical protein